jgi:hypothetical protein
MSINYSSRKTCKLISDRRTYKIITTVDSDPYPNEGVNFHRSKGWRNQSKAKRRKELIKYEVREYRTWKYNRRNQWKE